MLYGDGLHDDSAELQKMLDRRGIVTLEHPGVYAVARTLVLHENTRFILSPGAHILAAPRSLCSLIENEHFRGGGYDANIEIAGGIFDGNCDEMGLDAVEMVRHREDEPYSPDRFTGKLVRFAHVRGLTLTRMTVRDPVSYGIQIADADGFTVRDITFDYNCRFGTTDGVHINGPSRGGLIEDLRGVTNDDMVGITVIDERHAEVTAGDISDIVIRNIRAENGYSGVRLLSAGGFSITNVLISGVWGTFRHNAVLMTHHNMRPGEPNWYDNIIIEHIHVSKSGSPLAPDRFTYWEKNAIEKAPLVWFGKGIEADRVTLRDVTRIERADTEAPLVLIEKGNIRRMVMENISQTLCGQNAPLLVKDGSTTTITGNNLTRASDLSDMI